MYNAWAFYYLNTYANDNNFTTQYKAPRDLWVELDKNAVINIGLVRLFPWECPKVGRGAAK